MTLARLRELVPDEAMPKGICWGDNTLTHPRGIYLFDGRRRVLAGSADQAVRIIGFAMICEMSSEEGITLSIGYGNGVYVVQVLDRFKLVIDVFSSIEFEAIAMAFAEFVEAREK